jgi:pyruvate kinase
MIHKQADQPGKSMVSVGELMAVEQWIELKPGDHLILHKRQDEGENAVLAEDGSVLRLPHISCAVPEIFDDIKTGEPILFDDGKIEGIIETVSSEELLIKITSAKQTGSKLRGERGINLPVSNLHFSGLTSKDIENLAFVTEHADVVNISFVNDVNDVKEVLNQFENYGKQPGLILKIETRKGFQNLPLILLEAMQVKPLGVMIARGDLAVEAGWNNMAILQEEILRICEAAHIPDIWATQVLDEMSKKGIPSRAEITDAAMSQRAECVMLNKGPQITKTIKMLDKILRKMQEINKKKENILPKLPHAEHLLLHLPAEDTEEKKLKLRTPEVEIK